MNKGILIVVILAAVLVVGGFVVLRNGSGGNAGNPGNSPTPTPSPTSTPMPTETQAPSPTPSPTPTPTPRAGQSPSPSPAGSVKEFTVTGENFRFSLGEMKVRKGDTVRVTFKSTAGFHDWTIDEFHAATKQLTAGGQETVSFVADRAGRFEYYCSVGTHRQMGMKGTLIVE